MNNICFFFFAHSLSADVVSSAILCSFSRIIVHHHSWNNQPAFVRSHVRHALRPFQHFSRDKRSTPNTHTHTKQRKKLWTNEYELRTFADTLNPFSVGIMRYAASDENSETNKKHTQIFISVPNACMSPIMTIIVFMRNRAS